MLVENELQKQEKFGAAYFRVKNYFEEDDAQDYLVFQPVYKYFQKTGDKVSLWKSKGLSDEKIISTTTSTDKSAMKTIYDNHGPVLNIYIVYETTLDTKTSNTTLENCLSGAIKKTKNSDVDKIFRIWYWI